MQRRTAFAAIALVAALAAAGCGPSDGKQGADKASATPSQAGATTATTPATPLGASYDTPPPRPGCPKPEPALAGHCNGESALTPACLGITAEQAGKALGYSGKLVVAGDDLSCSFNPVDGTDGWTFTLNYELDSQFTESLKHSETPVQQLAGFPTGTEAWSYTTQGTPEVFLRARAQRVTGVCFRTTQPDTGNTPLCQFLARVLLRKFPPLG
jgi:hypothetical protein